jgi:hypothetical protein
MPKSAELVLDLDSADDTSAWRSEAARVLDLPLDDIGDVRIRRRSLDARGAYSRAPAGRCLCQ